MKFPFNLLAVALFVLCVSQSHATQITVLQDDATRFQFKIEWEPLGATSVLEASGSSVDFTEDVDFWNIYAHSAWLGDHHLKYLPNEWNVIRSVTHRNHGVGYYGTHVIIEYGVNRVSDGGITALMLSGALVGLIALRRRVV